MFQSLRPNSQVYVLHKGTAVLEKGSVVRVSDPVPDYTAQMFGRPQELIVDLIVKINNQDVSFKKIPANRDIADSPGDNIVISCSRDAMNAEVVSLKQQSTAIVDSVGYHNDMIAKCDAILTELNPEFAEKKQQEKEISSLKEKLDEMSKNFEELLKLNKDLLQLKKE